MKTTEAIRRTLVLLGRTTALLAWSLGLAVLPARPGVAAMFTIATTGTNGWSDLQTALNSAAANSEDDEIRIRGGLTLLGTGTDDNTRYLNRAAGDSYNVIVSGGWNAAFDARHPGLYGTTVLNADSVGPGAPRRRVFKIASKTTLAYLDITGGLCNDHGSGIYVASTATNSRLSHLNIYSNRMVNLEGGGFKTYAGLVVEYCTISNNAPRTGYGLIGGAGSFETGASTLSAIFNSTIQGNTATGSGGALYKVQGNVQVYGSLLYGNDCVGGGYGSVCYGGSTWRFVNSTVADNYPGENDNPGFGGANATYEVRNSIVSSNELGFVPYTTYWLYGKFGGSVVDDVTNQITTVTIETPNQYVAPSFVNRAGRNYRPASASAASVDLGGYLLAMTAGEKSAAFGEAVTQTVRYVDTNNNGNYDARTDVIVDLGGYSAGDPDDFANAKYLNNFIYTTDLAGLPRVIGTGIDAGAYEWQPLAGFRGTVFRFR